MLGKPDCCVDPACSHALVSAASHEASRLSVTERQIILGVLKRNELLQKDQQYRIMRLKAELQILRRKGALKPSPDHQQEAPDPDRSCGRCRIELGRVINRGAYCRACRLKVCKGCREYSCRTTDWVCTVCHKHMEIQAASGEWMNEFVRRPSRRRDNRVYVPAADIIKRTIRRSWTISNPTSRWNAVRGAPETRPYNSLPRGQDISNYPSLAAHQTPNIQARSPIAPRKHSPAKRSHSEDVYNERPITPPVKASNEPKAPQQRVNPLIKYAAERKQPQTNSESDNSDNETDAVGMGKNKRKLRPESAATEPVKQCKKTLEGSRSLEVKPCEKRVSFENRSASETAAEVHEGAVELCDIEPLSGTVFRKVTVRRRRQDMRKMPAIDTGWRRGGATDSDLLDILLPEGDDYKLVFISSDSSSKEEDVDDNDSSSTASSFPIDECDWDYFEPGGGKPVLNWTSPFGSPRVVRKTESPAVFVEDEAAETVELCVPEQPACKSCGGGGVTQYIPIPVPVPVPVTQESVVMYTPETIEALRTHLRVLPRALWPYLTQAAKIWPLVHSGEPSPFVAPVESDVEDKTVETTDGIKEVVEADYADGYLESENKYDNSSSGESCSSGCEDDDTEVKFTRTYNFGTQSDATEDTDSTSDESDDSDVSDKKKKKYSRVYVVNEDANTSSTTSSTSSDDDDDGCCEEGIVLKCVKILEDDNTPVISDCDNKLDGCEKVDEDEDTSSSPGLSDVSAESLNSSDVEDKALSVRKTSEWNVNAGPRSDEPVSMEGTATTDSSGEKAGEERTVIPEPDCGASRHAAARYTSLVMITQDTAPSFYAPVSVVTSDTTTLVPDNDVVVRHTNWQAEANAANKENNKPAAEQQQALTGYFTLTLENDPAATAKQVDSEDNEDVMVVATTTADTLPRTEESVTVITGADTLSAVVCLEEGLADDDSWVENLSHDDEEDDDFEGSSNDSTTSSSGEEVTLHCTAAIDHEDELRGYHRAAIDFTLHTIVEESCEESEVEQTTSKKPRPASATDLEKYFYFGLGDGINRDDAFSETSSICSESMDSFSCVDDNDPTDKNADPADLASSRLEKYFLSGFTSFKRDSDGSVGSDSEGRPSPEQRRKRLVRARGTGRSHSSSLDNLISDLSSAEQNADNQNSEDSSSSDTDTYDDNSFDKNDGQFDTVKRKKNNKKQTKTTEESKIQEEDCISDEDGHKTPQPSDVQFDRTKQQSRDSGFIGSNDDLNKDPPDNPKSDNKNNLYNISEEKRVEVTLSTPPATSLTRKDSFNNWSSDEETNLMMCKMRQFFKTMVANNNPSSKPTTPIMGPKPSPRMKNRCKPPQLVYFENELTRLMKTVPGIREDQVREIVEYLSSEDTWSDSYDSSDYTSSDLENNAVCAHKSALQQQISDSCKEIINKFDGTVDDEEGDEGDGGIVDESHGLNRETAFVYQKLVASFEKMATGDGSVDSDLVTPHNSPPLIAKVMHHIGSRLVALMHEVSSGESHASSSPKTRHYHRRLVQKLSNSSTTTTEDDDSTSDTNLADKLSALEDHVGYNLLPRSRSHDLLVGESRNLHQSSSGVSDIAEEREASDCERFSWRGSFESALLATDSRNKLSLLGGEGSASASALAIAAKRRSAGDLLFTHKSLSREQLDRVRSCGSIGGASSEDKLWTRPSRRRSSVPDASCGSGGSADGEDDDEELEIRSTLPRSLQTGTATTNSLPRLPTNTTPSAASIATAGMHKAQSMYHFLQQNVKSARYRPPGFNRLITSVPKRAVSAPGLQPTPQRRGARRQQTVVPNDEISLSEAHSSPMLASRTSKSATPSPVAHKSRRAIIGGSQEWHSNEDDIDRLVAIHHTRSSFSNLGSRSDSMASVYSGAGEGRYGTVAVRGQVEFGLQYNYKAGALEISVKKCIDLAAVDTKRNRSDPYVKVYLLPDKSKSGKRKTKVKKHTLNPVFDECLKFHISLNGLETRTLWLTVWHSDMFGRNDFLGEVMMTLENKVFDDPTPKCYNLQERTEPFDDILSFKGDILVGLKFVPPDMTVHKKGKRSRGALHVLVKEAKSLTAVKANGTSDPFCKSYLLPDKGRSGKQKTSVTRRTVNPTWNHTFVYDDVTLQELAERCLELTVWDHDRLASNEFLGGVRFSLGTGKHYGKGVDWMDATGKEMTLWKSMLERPNFWVEGCLSLRPTLDYRSAS